MSYTPLELARRAAEHLAGRGFENARLEAELLLAHVLGLRRLDLYLQHDRPLTAEEVEAFRALVRRRLHHEPLQYITGEAAFRELTLKADRRALIPRPETEVLVGEVLAWARERILAPQRAQMAQRAQRTDGPAERGERATEGAGASPLGKPAPAPEKGETAGSPLRPSRSLRLEHSLTAVDVGTGSGAIALSLALEGPFERVVATDVSAEALELAAENASAHGLRERTELRQGRGFTALGADERFDVVVSNPPYVAEPERGMLAPEVREWEPAAALFAGVDGLDVIREVVAGAPCHLTPGGLLALEVGLGQAAAVAALVEGEGAYARVWTVPDLAGRERIVLAERGVREATPCQERVAGPAWQGNLHERGT